MKERVSSWLITLPTCGSNIEQMIAERERVVSQLAMEGTHQGTWMGISPTGKKLHIRITIHRVANDDETIGAVHREDGDGDVTDGCDWLSVAEKASWHDREMVRPQLRTLNHLED